MTKTAIEQLKKKQGQINARLQALEAAEKTRERKKDLRRKILLGAYLLEKLKQDDLLAKELQAELGGYLKRDNDRALFGFCALASKKTENAAETIA